MDVFKNFRMGHGFCKRLETLAIEETIPYLERALYDEIDGAEKSHAIENFRLAAEMNETGECRGTFYGMVFQDSDVAKWLEAAAYSLYQKPDARLHQRVRDVVALIERAQQKDGYLNTYFTVKEPGGRFSNLREAHELYCAGHMMEAAVALWECTGDTQLLDIMRRMADMMVLHFQGENSDAFPGHPEVELALYRLYQATGETQYRDLALQFINARGTSDFYQKELDKDGVVIWSKTVGNPAYSQAHKPVREQTDAVGHAVRAVYLYAAMADLAGETGDASLLAACKTLWQSITRRRLYITGGIGSSAKDEAFTVDYDLPNDTAYAETCAAIGLIFFARRMLELETGGQYADTMELALYNGVTAGVALDGKSFFYVNPLEAIQGVAGDTINHSHVRTQRAQWFACACCPPNAARLFTSLGRYAWGVSEDTLYSHLYIAGELNCLDTHGMRVALETEYPVGDTLQYRIVQADSDRDMTLAVRIPAWSQQTAVLINGETTDSVLTNGYVYLRSLRSGDTVTVKLDMRPRRMYPSWKIAADSGRVAFMRGPLVYCAEGVDNQGDVLNLSVSPKAEVEMLADDCIGDVPKLRVAGFRAADTNALYSAKPPQWTDAGITLIPYFAWANRGVSDMRCFLPERG